MVTDRQTSVLRQVQTLYQLGLAGGLTDGELLARFVGRRGEAAEMAFAELVERHGPTVLRVCRSALRDEHDAQDAFQATFLILARRADSVRRRDSVGSWLHGVALRVAGRARSADARRRVHERRAGALTVAEEGGSPDPGDRLDLVPALHEEVGWLPERFRAAVVLCYLEGLTCEAAARQLGWPVGTVKSRLARGRRRLRDRLARRGFAPDGAAFALALAPASAPTVCNGSVVKAALRFVESDGGAAAISESVLLLTKGVLKDMGSISMKALVTVSLAVILSAGLLVRQGAGGGRAPENPGQEQAAPGQEAGDRRARHELEILIAQRDLKAAEFRLALGEKELIKARQGRSNVEGPVEAGIEERIKAAERALNIAATELQVKEAEIQQADADSRVRRLRERGGTSTLDLLKAELKAKQARHDRNEAESQLLKLRGETAVELAKRFKENLAEFDLIAARLQVEQARVNRDAAEARLRQLGQVR